LTPPTASNAEPVEDLIRVNGLEENLEVVAADPGIAEEVGGSGLAGEQQDAAAGYHAGDLNSGFNATHTGHNDVGEENVRMEMARGLDSFLAAINGSGFEAILIENHAQGVGDDAFVVGDKDSGPDPAVGGTRVHETFGRSSLRMLGLVQRVYRWLAEISKNYFDTRPWLGVLWRDWSVGESPGHRHWVRGRESRR
jgi:hypothetical protein